MSENETFILGAGFSKEISENMPSLEELSVRIWDEIEGLLPEKNFSKVFKTDIEALLTYASKEKSWQSETENYQYKSVFERCKDLISFIIQQEELKALKKVEKSDLPWFEDLIGYWVSNDTPQSNILTFNYDTLFERFFSEVEGDRRMRALNWKQFYDIPAQSPELRMAKDSSPSPIREIGSLPLNLRKLHGSINWFYSGSNEYLNENISIVSTRGWELRESPEVHPLAEKQKRYAKGLDTFILPPIYEKDRFLVKKSLTHIWEKSFAAIKRSKKIYLLGYSFPKSDDFFSHFILDSLAEKEYIEDTIPKPKEIIPVNISEEVLSNLKTHFEKEDRITITDRFIGSENENGEDKPIPKLAENLSSKVPEP